MAQSVWVATHAAGLGIKLVDATGKPQMAVSAYGAAIDGAHFTQNGTAAIIEATRLASSLGRRIVSVTPIQNELVFVVD